ncbi:MAG: FHA domain-containing protein, partial [Lachnospiraceae bacterium]|nr:FHA domain-containing protein [Lachnospiraceae bacterium]
EATVEDVEEAVEEPEAAVEDVEEAVEEPEVAVEDVEEAVEEPEAAVEDVEEAVEEPEAAVEDVEEAVEELEATVEDVEEAVEELEATVEDVEEAVEEPEAAVEDIEEAAVEVVEEAVEEDIEEVAEEPEVAVEDTEELAKNEVFNTETDIDEDAQNIIDSLKKKVEQEQHATVLEEVQKVIKKPTFKTKDTSSSGVVIEDDFDDFVAEMERAEKAAKHEETGLKIKKSIKVNRASVAKSNRDEIKEEVAADNKVEEEVDSNVIQSQTVAATAVVKTVDVPKANPYLVRVNTEERIMITKQNFKVGKASMGVDYTVKGNSAVSRVHAIIVNKDDTYYVKDNKSTNHTFVNGKILDEGENEPLTHDCKIVLGDEEFVFKLR